jgi:hypothetical protein
VKVAFRKTLSVCCVFLAFCQFNVRRAAAQKDGGVAPSAHQVPNSPEGSQGWKSAANPPGTTPAGAASNPPSGGGVQGTPGTEEKKPPAENSSVPTPKLSAITPAAPLIGPNQSLTLTGSDFQDKLAVTLIDPQGNPYDLPSADIVQVKSQRVVVVATLGIGGRWKVTATNPGGKASDALEFSVANSPAICLKSPRVYAFGVAALITTALLAFLFIVMLLDMNKALKANQWSLADALSEESAYQPKVINRKQDVIMVASTSRLIALLGLLGILTTVLGIGYSIMWNLFIYGTIPDLTQVRSFLFGSACLFAPYLANQVGWMFSPSGTPKPAEAATPSTAITGVAPAQLRSKPTVQTVSLTGTGFQSGLAVTLTDPQDTPRTLAATEIVSVDPTLVAASLVLDTPGSWKVAVANPAAAPTSVFLFTVFGPPAINQTDPGALTHNAAAAQQFTFVGTGFMSGLTLTLTGPNGAVPSFINSLDSTHVVVTATLADAGAWNVVITNPGNYASPQFGFTVT